MLALALITPTEVVSVQQIPVTAAVIEEEVVISVNTPQEIEKYIEVEALKKGLNPVKAQSIAWAESRFIKDAKNGHSTASGIFQFLNGTFSDYCIKKYKLTDSMANKNDPKIQTECALRMLKAGGESHWYASRANWHKYVPTASLTSPRSL